MLGDWGLSLAGGDAADVARGNERFARRIALKNLLDYPSQFQ